MRAAPSRVTPVIVAVTTGAWALATLTNRIGWLSFTAGFIPARVPDVALPGALPVWLTPLSASLVHAGLLHVVFNMLMLGGWRTALIYVVGAYAAALGQYAWDPHSVIPVVGASGAISAIIAAYAVLYGQRRVLPKGRLGGLLNILWLAAAWIVLQLLVGLATSGEAIHIALAEHIGGFIAGLLLARPLQLLKYRNA